MDFVEFLPNDIIALIFKQLGFRNIVKCIAISKSWQSSILSNDQDHGLFKHLVFDQKNSPNIWIDHINLWTARAGIKLHSLRISGHFTKDATKFTNSNTKTQNSHYPQLETLFLHNNPNLKSIHMDVLNSSLFNWEYFASTCKFSNLHSLSVPNSSFTDENLQDVLCNLTHLKKLNVKYCINVKGSGFNFHQQDYARLRSLKIVGCSMTESGFTYMTKSQCSSIESLEVTVKMDVKDSVFKNIPKFEKLNSLVFHFFSEWYGGLIHENENCILMFRNGLKDLRYLTINVLFGSLCHDFIESLAKYCAHKLEFLEIKCDRLNPTSNDEWTTLINNLTNIRILHIPHAIFIESSAFIKVSYTITELCVQGCEQLTDNFIDFVAENAVNLTSLNVSKTSLSANALANAIMTFPRLTYMNASNCFEVSKDSYCVLLELGASCNIRMFC